MGALPAELTPTLSAALELLTAGIFAAAVFHKLSGFTRFTGFVAGYRLLPAGTVKAASGVIVLLEIVAIAGALGATSALVVLPAAVLILYALAMTINLVRGRSSIDCGCGGAPMPLSAALVLRNLALAAGYGWSLGSESPMELMANRPYLFLIAAACALGLGVCYAAFNQLQANRSTHQRLWTARA